MPANIPGTDWPRPMPRYPLIDGVIVSGEWLTDERYVIRDDELTVAVDPLWHHLGDQGAHHSRAEGVKKEEEVTDHLPLVVELELT